MAPVTAGMAYPWPTIVYPKQGIPCPRAGGTSSSRIIGHLALIIVIQLLVMVPPSKSEGKYTFQAYLLSAFFGYFFILRKFFRFSDSCCRHLVYAIDIYIHFIFL